jgi:hypothetical protein
MKMISNIVFTKNRPLQLDAYLESLYRYFPSELIQTYVIYKIELFEEQYNRLFSKYPNCTVIEENDFHSDFLKILNEITTNYILFGIDDVVYFDSVDFEVIDEIFNKRSKDTFGFSLRFSKENVKDGNDPIIETIVAGQTVYSLNWTQGRSPSTSYPFELCATIYPSDLVKRVINSVINNNPLIRKLFSSGSALMNVLAKIISTRPILKSFGYFFNPNTLESWNCRWCQNHSNEVPGFLYFQKQCATAIQVNMVNVTMRKTFDGSAEHTVEALNEKYKHGYRLDIDFVSGNKPTAPHCGQEYLRLTRN